MNRPRRIPKTSAILERVRSLTDGQLAGLITELRFNTRLEQTVLSKALLEQRRRKRRKDTAP